jgi:hypothetical protein
MKKIVIIEAVLTILLLGSFVISAKMTSLVYTMPESSPAHHVWQSHFEFFADIVTYVLYFPWIAFTVIFIIFSFVHLGAWIFRKLTP